jgi:tetratricopeptide (TPR) repeat protein
VAFAMLYSGDTIGALNLSDKLANPVKLKLVGLANINLSKNVEAKKNLEEYLTMRPDDLYVALRLADIYFAEGQFTKAQALYVQCQSDLKLMLSALYGEMKVELAKSNYRQALRIAQRIEKINPTSEISNYAKMLEKHCAEME